MKTIVAAGARTVCAGVHSLAGCAIGDSARRIPGATLSVSPRCHDRASHAAGNLHDLPSARGLPRPPAHAADAPSARGRTRVTGRGERRDAVAAPAGPPSGLRRDAVTRVAA